jgi:hypothetical protein
MLKPEGHLDKASAFEDRAMRWESDRDAPSVIEDVFDACVHYVAYGINVKYGKDIDSHNSQKRFLKEQKEDEVRLVFDNIEYIRISSVYGGGWNGEKIKEALDNLKEVKKWIGKQKE